MVRHYALKPKASICPYTNPRGQKSKELSKRAFQQVRTYGSLRFKGIVSDHGSTVLAVTYIGYGFKNPTNLGSLDYCEKQNDLQPLLLKQPVILLETLR